MTLYWPNLPRSPELFHPQRHQAACTGHTGVTEPGWGPGAAQLLSQTVDGLALCCPRKDTPALPSSPKPPRNIEHRESQGHGKCPKHPGLWKAPSPSLQGAFWEEVSSRHSGRWGLWPGIHRVATLGARPLDVQEPGPEETRTRTSDCLGPGSEWGRGTAHCPHCRSCDRPVEGPVCLEGWGRMDSHLPQKSLRTATRLRDRSGRL